ncbi:hypothetical protein N657DRAFT_678732 [Parathielavia appendiculata]|uniref:Uncharacterized protein n=1 Tax=Parathielavia appendiculata TaxID=2587402 RepID=A0AAN6Z660_9PEZI|nr:hypothetical protein N657DRAFT_678732 [Parathielavia appendiculata]
MAPVNRLPTELVSGIICTHLEPLDIFALRLSSRDVSAKCFDHFANRFFASLHLLVTSHNLALLNDIAAHPVLGTRVRELWITPALFGGDYNEPKHIFPARDPQAAYRRHVQDVVYKAAVEDHLSIILSVDLRRALEDAFQRLPNLKSVGLRHRLHHTDYRLRLDLIKEGMGYNALCAATGREPALPWLAGRTFQGFVSAPGRVFSNMLMALVTSHKKIDSLDTCGGSSCFGLDLDGIELSDAQWDSVFCSLADLKALHLCIRDPSLRDPSLPDPDWATPTPSDKTLQATLNIMAKASPSIEILSFSIFGFGGKARHFEWAAQRVRFANLSRLTLWDIETSPQQLKQFLLSASPTLRWFKFWTVRLYCADAQGTGVEDADAAGKRAWRGIWDFFRDSMKLHRLEFKALYGPSGRLRLVDGLHGPHGSHPLVPATDLAFFDAELAKVSFCEWIDQIEFGTDEDSEEELGGFEL